MFAKRVYMEVAVKLDWPNHQHVFRTLIVTRDHYYDEELIYCIICDKAAKQSNIPHNKHFEHPKGCKCYWCVYCECDNLRKRESL